MGGKYAILMDGGFVKKKIQQRTRSFPTVLDIDAEVTRIKAHSALAGCEMLRVYWYDAMPASGKLKNPIDATTINLGNTPIYSANTGLYQGLELQPDFALRMGE